MLNPESPPSNQNVAPTEERIAPIEFLALVAAGMISQEDLDENNRTALSFYRGVMADNPEFAAQVNARKTELLNPPERKIPLYSPEVIEKLKKFKKRKLTKRKDQIYYQPRLLPEELTLPSNPPNSPDPQKKLNQLERDFDKPPRWRPKHSPLTEEINHKKMELRNRLGLPIARGKDPHVNDNFYKFLVKNIYRFDKFGIFTEYDRELSQISPELSTKIEQVAGLIDELLNQGLNLRQQYQEYYHFLREFWDRE